MSLKVLHLTSTKGGIGGAEKLLLDLSDKYDFDRFSVAYCNVFSDDGENEQYVRALRERELTYFPVEGGRYKDIPQVVRNLVRLFRRERFDIVHTHLLHASIIGQLAAKIARVPVRIITRHYTNDCYHQGHSYLDKLDSYVARKATKVIAISNAVKNDLLAQGVSSNNVKLIYNGISLKPFDEAGKSFLRDSYPNKYLIAFVANFHYRKGHEYLLRAVARLASEFKDIHLLLIGEGELRERLEDLTAELKLEESVSFLGYQADIPSLLKDIDLYVHASVLEPLGIAILEAMAARKCVVATEVGGVPEIIKHGESGFLVPSKDPTALADAICAARKNANETEQMADAGRRRVEEIFSLQSMINHYQNLYDLCRNESKRQVVFNG